MRLPDKSELNLEEEHSLHEHDVAELHAPIPTLRSTTYGRRLDLILEMLKRFSPDGPMVDVACAQGNLAISLAERGRISVGLDLRPAFLGYARKKDSSSSVAGWVAASVEALPLRNGSVAAVVLGEIVEHVAYPERLFQQASAALLPGGVVLASTPNGDRIRTGLPTLGEINDRSALERHQFKPDADGHLFLLTRAELCRVAAAAGLELEFHGYIQSPALTGWPRIGKIVERLPLALRQKLDRIVQATPLARFVAAGQVAVFRQDSRTVIK